MTYLSNVRFQIWAPFVFCAALSVMKMTGGGSGDPVFFWFLPMCFVGVASVHLSLVKRINTLESALAARATQAHDT